MKKDRPEKAIAPRTQAAPLKVLPALTAKQSRCLLYIFNYYSEHRHFPTHKEITQAMGSRSRTAAMYLDPLIEKGYLMRGSRASRNIRITTDGVERLRLMGVSV
jgi:SOS-response transcriptional repressor LexA